MKEITSRQNSLVKRCRTIVSGDDPDRLVIDGVKLVAEAARSGIAIESLLLTEAFMAEHPEWVDWLGAETDSFQVTDDVLDAVADVRTPQGVSAVARTQRRSLDEIFSKDPGFVVLLDGVQDPGNLGGILRTAEAAGADGAIVLSGSADPWRSKSARGSMGSVFRLPVASGVTLAELEGVMEGRALVGADADGAVPHTKFEWQSPFVLILGREGTGMSEAVRALKPETVSIEMAEGVESLNVGAAAAVLMFEARRQRSGA